MDGSVLEVLTALLSLVSAVGVLVVNGKVDRLTGRVDSLTGLVDRLTGRIDALDGDLARRGGGRHAPQAVCRRPLLTRKDRRPRPATARVHPFTHTTCFRVCTTSTRSDELAMTVSMSL